MKNTITTTLFVLAMAALLFLLVWLSFSMFEYDCVKALGRFWSIATFVTQCIINTLIVLVFKVIKNTLE